MIFPIGRRVLLFTEITVSVNSAAPGRTLHEFAEPGACKILAPALVLRAAHGSGAMMIMS